MAERYLHALQLADAGEETPEQTRERLKAQFPRNAVRRMTQLGLLVGSVLHELPLAESDAVVYASTYAETRALEDYLASFPTPSPALFQTSIHPSAVEQALIARTQPVRWFVPLSGGARLARQALVTALLLPAARVVLVGGEERGTWLRERRLASERSFAFACFLTAEPAGALARLALETGEAPDAPADTAALQAALRDRTPLTFPAAPGRRLQLDWLP